MCGIVGYIGSKQACPILIKGLRRLEYRGYDSAGVSMINDRGELNVFKAKGKVDDLVAFLDDKDVSGTIGIAHTRWATHGVPCRENAHPHYSSSGTLSLIHNGIIENYASLKEKLIEHGYTFVSETDTEVLVQLIEYYKITYQLDLLSAVQRALAQVIGAYAIAVLDRSNPDEIIAARKSSPLAIGLGDGEFFLASDATPLVEYTHKVIYVDDDEIAVINRHSGVNIVTLQGQSVSPEVSEVTLDLGAIEKGGYEHFMLKEI
ncbi:MAG: class II glutamine amidotransferase, partial [Bacteroidaceae bacterium]|nr:class II glutamine amidotransferase [Bacteroidaceae bacterium]